MQHVRDVFSDGSQSRDRWVEPVDPAATLCADEIGAIRSDPLLRARTRRKRAAGSTCGIVAWTPGSVPERRLASRPATKSTGYDHAGAEGRG